MSNTVIPLPTRRFAYRWSIFFLCLMLAVSLRAQTPVAQPSIVPHLVLFSGVLKDPDGKAQSGTVGITFGLYKEEQDGSPLWLETQNVQLDAKGHYSVYLGAAKSEGLPSDLFVAGEARWLGVRAEGQVEQPRILLVAVPYALKAGDAETLGGRPASAYALAGAPVAMAGGTSGPAASVVTAAGAAKPAVQPMTTCSSVTSDGAAAVNALAKFTSPCNVEGSAVSENGGRVGIGGAGVTGAKLALTDTQTDFGLKWLQHSVFGTSATATGTNYALALDADASNMTIPAGVTDNGYRLGVYGRGFAYTSGFAGTLAQQFGVNGSAGILGGKSGAKVVSAYGGYYQIFNSVPGTTITNAYGVYISNAGTAGTISNRYDLFASSANANNYFAGNVGISTTAPLAPLHIDHTPTAGVGQDMLMITSAKTGDVASLLLQNTAPGLRLRHGVGTDSAYIASSGPLQLITADTGSPNHPSSAALSIASAGDVTMNHSLTVEGSAGISNSLTVQGNLGIGNFNPATKVDVTGAGHFTGNLNVDGNIGIGNSSPTAKLDVTGAGHFSGNLNVGGTLSGTLGAVRVTGSTVTIGQGSTGTAIATCPSPMEALSGGFEIGGPGSNAAAVQAAGIIAFPDHFQVTVANDNGLGGPSISVTAVAICMNITIND